MPQAGNPLISQAEIKYTDVYEKIFLKSIKPMCLSVLTVELKEKT